MDRAVLDFGLSKEIAYVALIAYEGKEINPTVHVRTVRDTNPNKTIIRTTFLKIEPRYGKIPEYFATDSLEDKHYSLMTTPSGPILVVWSGELRPENERRFQGELDCVARAMRGLAGLASAA